MNKREQFYKNLSEFNIQEKPKVEKVEFKDIKTLEKLGKQLETAISKLDDSKIKSAKLKFDDINVDLYNVRQELQRAQDTTQELELDLKDLKEQIKKATKAEDVIDKKYTKIDQKYEKAARDTFDANDKYIANFQKGEAIADKLEQAMFDVQEAAKKLGVRVSVSQYDSLLNSFYANERDPLSKLDFDY